MNELVAASAMMRVGYAIYFPADRSGYVDLLATRGRRTYRVQVKTAHRHRKDTVIRTKALHYPKGSVTILAVVIDKSVWVIPWNQVRGRQTLRLSARWRIT